MNNMKISELLTTTQIDPSRQKAAADDSFKFSLISNIMEKDLQEKVGGLMAQIT